MLVDVAIDDVELARLLVERFDRVSDVKGDGFVQSGPAQVVPRLPLVLRIAVRQVQGALGADRPGEPVAGVAVPGAELEDLLRADAPGQEFQHDPDHALDDREAPLPRFGLHLEQNGLVVASQQAPDVVLDPGVGDIHDRVNPIEQ